MTTSEIPNNSLQPDHLSSAALNLPPDPEAKARVEHALKAALEKQLAQGQDSSFHAGFGDGVSFGDGASFGDR